MENFIGLIYNKRVGEVVLAKHSISVAEEVSLQILLKVAPYLSALVLLKIYIVP